jgi:hypothetical protein
MVAVGQTGGFAPGMLDLFLKLYQVITSASDFLTIIFIGSSMSFVLGGVAHLAHPRKIVRTRN